MYDDSRTGVAFVRSLPGWRRWQPEKCLHHYLTVRHYYPPFARSLQTCEDARLDAGYQLDPGRGGTALRRHSAADQRSARRPCLALSTGCAGENLVRTGLPCAGRSGCRLTKVREHMDAGDSSAPTIRRCHSVPIPPTRSE